MIIAGDGRAGLNGDGIWAVVQWDPDGAGPASPAIVVAGAEMLIGDTLTNTSMWDGVRWRAMTSPTPLSNLTVFNGALYGTTGSVVRRWDGTGWPVLGVFNDTVSQLIVFRDHLVAIGAFTSHSVAGPVNYVAQFDGVAWTAMGSGFNTPPAPSAQPVIYDGKLVVSGSFTMAGGAAVNNIAQWDGSTWSRLGNHPNSFASGLGTKAAEMLLHEGMLIARGAFTTAGGEAAPGIARWTGTAWWPMGQGTVTQPGAFVSFQGQLLAYDVRVGVRGLYRWTGSDWVSYPTPGLPNQPVMSNLLPFGGALWSLVSTSAGTTLQRSIGAEWTLQALSGYPNKLAVVGQDLIVIGSFSTAGGIDADNIARFDGTDWQPLGNGAVNVPTVFASRGPELIAAGQFSVAGSSTVERLAVHDGATWHPVPSHLNGDVFSLATIGQDAFIAGAFTAWGGGALDKVAKVTPDGTATSLGTLNNQVKGLCVHDGSLYAAGAFTGVDSNGQSIHGVARWDGAEWASVGGGLGRTAIGILEWEGRLAVVAPDPLNPGTTNVWVWDGEWTNAASLTGLITSFCVWNHRLVFTLYFECHISSCTYTQVRALSEAGWETLLTYSGGRVRFNCVASHEGELYLGWRGLSRYNGAAWSTLFSWGPTEPAAITALGSHRAQLLVAGNFDYVESYPQPKVVNFRFARLYTPVSDFDQDGSGGTEQDIEAFFACLAGHCCPMCLSADFNADGDTGTDQDIEMFFRVLAGGC